MNRYYKYVLCSMSVLGVTMLASCMGIEEDILKDLMPSDLDDEYDDQDKKGEDLTISYELNETFSYQYDNKTDGYIISSFANHKIKTLSIPNRVIEIGREAFYNATSLKTICLPNSIRNIGRHAFFGCVNLENIYFDGTLSEWCMIKFEDYQSNPMRYAKNFYILDPNGDVSFNENTYSLLTNLVIPDDVCEVGEYQFYGLQNLTSVTIHKDVWSIGEDAFAGCQKLFEIYNLSSLDIHEGYENNGKIALYARVIHDNIMNNSAVRILDNGLVFAYADNKGYLLGYIGIKTSINLPNNFWYDDILVNNYEINDYAFNGCRTLSNISISESVTKIGECAFKDCVLLDNVVLPDGCKYIKNSAFYGCSNLKEIHLPNEIGYISDNMFYDCKNLKEISIPKSISYIGRQAFEGCSSLNKIEIPNGCVSIKENAFYDCKSLTSVILPESLTSIGFQAFEGCVRLVEIYNLSNIYILNNSTTNGCVGKYALIIHEKLKDKSIVKETNDAYIFAYANDMAYLIGYNGSDIELKLPESLDYNGSTINQYAIYDYAFYDMDNIKTVDIPGCVIGIGKAAFLSCDNIIEVSIKDSCKYIMENAFCDCISLKSIILPNTLKEIKSYTFYNCQSLIDVSLPNELESIGYSSFYGCTSLVNIIIPSKLTTIRNYAFRGCNKLIEVYNLSELDIRPNTNTNGYVSYNADKVHNSLASDSIVVNEDDFIFSYVDEKAYLVGYSGSNTSISLPTGFSYNGVYIDNYSIYRQAFLGDANITQIKIPKNVIRIEDKAFLGCTSLEIVDIEPGIKTIGQYAFSGCIRLKDITIPEGVLNIGGHSFDGCMLLKSITLPKSLLSIGGYSFNNCLNLKNIFYMTTDIEANNIIIGGSNDAIFNAASYYYSELEPELIGKFWHYDNNSRIIW